MAGLVMVQALASNQNYVPNITSFSPKSGKVGSTVTITGTGFTSNTSLITVKIGGVQATATEATATSITITVPEGAVTGSISVLITTNMSTSSENFTVLTAPTGLECSSTSLSLNVQKSISTVTCTATSTETITYSISPSLPSGLSLDSSTGKITGTPASGTKQSATNYTITAKNDTGEVTTNLSIAILPNFTKETTIYSSDDIGLDIFFRDAQNGIFVGQNGTVYTTANGGTSWTKRATGITNTINAVHFASGSSTGYLALAGGILKSTDGGATWPSATNAAGYGFMDVHAVSADKAFIVGYKTDGSGVIHRTTNGGTDNWPGVLTVAGNKLYSVHFTDANNGIVVGANGLIKKTSDSGDNWSTITSGTSNSLEHVHFVDSNNGWIGGSSATLLKTTDGGSTWSSVDVSSVMGSNAINSVHFVSTNTGYIAGNCGKLAVTYDGGSTWTAIGTNFDSYCISGFTKYLKGIYFANATTGFVFEFTYSSITSTSYSGTIYKYVE